MLDLTNALAGILLADNAPTGDPVQYPIFGMFGLGLTSWCRPLACRRLSLLSFIDLSAKIVLYLSISFTLPLSTSVEASIADFCRNADLASYDSAEVGTTSTFVVTQNWLLVFLQFPSSLRAGLG